jgi:hypothetical protein
MALTAAIVTVRDCSMSRSSACMSSSSWRPDDSSIFVNALMSAPAQKSSGLALAKMSAGTLPPTSAQTSLSACSVSGDSELAGGLFSQAIA